MLEEVDLEHVSARCELCPRCCGAGRARGEFGYCRAGSGVKVFRYGPHQGEEPSISGRRGSGAVFFSCCNLRCIYCQNYRWSQEDRGTVYDVDELAAVFSELRAAGCHNWNLVSPTPWLPWIVSSLELAGRDGKPLPVVYNTSGFERVETLRALQGIVDIYLVDLRYANSESAAIGSDAAGYAEYARAAVAEMWRQKGTLKLDEEGVAVSGVICRLLILPGLDGEACSNLRWLADRVGTEITLSVMAQYTPAYKARTRSPWDRPVDVDEYSRVCDLVEQLGFDRGWIQDYDTGSRGDMVGFKMKPVSLCVRDG
ncbi:radical SAM protein [Verrucomicrobiota bacterium]